jgi:hypothetical protein
MEGQGRRRRFDFGDANGQLEESADAPGESAHVTVTGRPVECVKGIHCKHRTVETSRDTARVESSRHKAL